MAVWNLKIFNDESEWQKGEIEVRGKCGVWLGIIGVEAFEGAIDADTYGRLLSGETVVADFVGTLQPDPEPCPDDPEYDAFLKGVVARQRNKRQDSNECH